jgi:hypothetical protein
MRHPSYAQLPMDEPLVPTHNPGGITEQKQIELMTELRELHNAIPSAFQARDMRIAALAASGSLSRRDMGTACDLAKSRIDQIIAEQWRRQQELWNRTGKERVRRHSRPS